MPINMKAVSIPAAVLLTRHVCPCRSSEVKKVQSEHAAMQNQLVQADAKAQAAEAQCLELEQQNRRQQQQKQQLVSACQPVFAWVRPADPFVMLPLHPDTAGYHCMMVHNAVALLLAFSLVSLCCKLLLYVVVCWLE